MHIYVLHISLFISCQKKYSQSEAWKPLHILRYSTGTDPTGSILSSFPAITCERLSKWRQNCVRTFKFRFKFNLDSSVLARA